jgi:RNA polymerase sigma-70 factor (ECF subfamily)
MNAQPEVELIAQGKQGDQTALSELFGRHYASSLRVARRILRSWDEAQDAVQTAYFSAFQHLNGFREDASFKTWISRIVVNCCLMQLRERGRRNSWVRFEDLGGGLGSESLASPAPTPEKATWYVEIGSAFTDAASKLPKHLREVYTLHSVSGLSAQEVATALGITLSAAKMRLFRANAGVRLQLQANVAGAFSRGAATRPMLGGATPRRQTQRALCR